MNNTTDDLPNEIFPDAALPDSRESMQLEDVLASLPVVAAVKYGPGQVIYCPSRPATSLYVVISGNVGISHVSGEGTEVLLEIIRKGELFGESAILGSPRQAEAATVLETANVMAWQISDLEGLIMNRPRLALALLQMIARRNADFAGRIESLATDTVEQRLARSLVRFSERLGSPVEDGAVWMMPLTHEMLSRYIGTTRGVVTVYMTRFRKQGFLTYSRRGILLRRDDLRSVFDRSAVRSAGAPS